MPDYFISVEHNHAASPAIFSAKYKTFRQQNAVLLDLEKSIR